MFKISACTIVKNEADNMHRWIESVKNFADEIIVVDTGSIDDTANIAATGGAQVYDFPWGDDFSAAKNFALDKANGDWVVFLDGDEFFTESSSRILRMEIEARQMHMMIIGFMVACDNIDEDNNDAVISQDWRLRIFRRDKHLRYHGRIHEGLQDSSPQKQSRHFAVMRNLRLKHTGYSSQRLPDKLQRNLKILRQDIAENGGEQPWHYVYLQDCYAGLGNYEKAIHYGRLALKYRHDTGLLVIENSLVCRLLNSIRLSGIGDYGYELIKAVTEFPCLPEVQFFYGQYLLSLLKGIEARQALQTALQLYARPVTKAEQLYNLTFGDMPQVASHYLEIIAKYELYFMAMYNGNYQQAARLAGDYLRSAYDNYPTEAMKPEYLFCTASKHDIDGED